MQPIPSPKTSPTSSANVIIGLCTALRRYVRGIVVTMMLGTLQAYKLLISPLLGSRCRFHPTCSAYAQQSVTRFGPVRGGWLAACRLCRCGPWHPGGIDEVPNAVNRNRA